MLEHHTQLIAHSGAELTAAAELLNSVIRQGKLKAYRVASPRPGYYALKASLTVS